MNTTRIVILVLALAAAGGAAFLIQRLMLNNNDTVVVEAAPEIEMVDVLVASQDIRAGDTVNSGAMRWQPWPADSVPRAFVTRRQSPDARDELGGSTARRDFTQDEPIVQASLVRAGQAGLMAALLSPGMRAMAVAISDETAVGGFILPGDRVDVVLTRESGESRGQRTFESATILTNLRVLAVDQIFSEDIDGGSKVSDTTTLELTPGQVEVLALAAQMGDISLTLRSFADMSSQGLGDVVDMPAILSGGGSNRNDDSHRVIVLRNGQSNRVHVQGGVQ